MIWQRWHWWSWILRRLALAQGFLDPIAFFATLQRFSKPSEVWAPTELLRSGMILQARGVINSQAIQHNMDWVWPHWVNQQFDPTGKSFIPRAFNVSHINMTGRNWTAVGLPDFPEYPLVDPRGLVTPHFDGWSVDAWILSKTAPHLIPARAEKSRQEIETKPGLAINTESENEEASLRTRTEVVMENGVPVCRTTFEAVSEAKSWLILSIRPYNPEGVSFVHDIQRLTDAPGWQVGKKDRVVLDAEPVRYAFSTYHEGDVFSRVLRGKDNVREVSCDVGMATAAAVYEMEEGGRRAVTVRVPLRPTDVMRKSPVEIGAWENCRGGSQEIRVPDKQMQFLHETALKTMILHCPGEVYPGPYTYKRFWFRDAALILSAMLSAGMIDRVEKAIDRFLPRQMPTGYFLSQDGEWDSNGEAIWIIHRFCSWTRRPPKESWIRAVKSGARWIQRKRTSREKGSGSLHAGLLPAGFSAEHLGPNDFYYWDDFWGVAGLRAAGLLMKTAGDNALGEEFIRDAEDLSVCIDRSVEEVATRLGHKALPASPYRRMDAGAIGSLAGGYPLQLWDAGDPRLLATASYLLENCFVHGGFYQEISHSGINAYLTLHVAQVLLRAGDPRFMGAVRAIAMLASPTGQWPEAIHPGTGGGCMGDGQHVWAAAEWVMMMRALFVREEEDHNKLVLCPGITDEWLERDEKMVFGPTLTPYGEITITVRGGKDPQVSWESRWHAEAPQIEVHLPGHAAIRAPQGRTSVRLKQEPA